jgi:hypothetical protein
VKDPASAAERWAAVLGLSAFPQTDAILVELTTAQQWLRFVAGPADRGEGITEVTIAGLAGEARIGGVRFVAGGQ